MLLVLALVPALAVDGFSKDAQSRFIHVAEGGLVFVTDVIPVSSNNETLRLGYPSDMSKNLVGHYLVGDKGDITAIIGEQNILWLEVKPKGIWSGPEVKVVTVWKDILVELPNNRYQLVLPANPILEKKIETIYLKLTIDGTPSITSITGADIEISNDKASAAGEVREVEPKQFKTLTIFFENPDLVFYIVDKAEVNVDLNTYMVSANIVLKNNGPTSFNSIVFYLGEGAKVMSVSSGLLKLGNTWDDKTNTLTVGFPESLTVYERITVKIVYIAENIAEKLNDKIFVRLPRFLNTSFVEYLLKITTPPVESISFTVEPWSLRVLENSKREATFRFENIYITGNEAVGLSIVAGTTFPLPAILLLAIAIAASMQVIVQRQKQKAPQPKAVLRQIHQPVEKLVETILEYLDYRRAIEKPAKTFDDQFRIVRETISEVRKTVKTSDLVSALNSLERQLNDLYSIVQALNKTWEDFKAGRISKTVYQRIFDGYRKECGKTAGNIYDIVERLIRQT